MDCQSYMKITVLWDRLCHFKFFKSYTSRCFRFPTHSIKNSLDLVNRISNITISHNLKFISFDVKSLFTSIPNITKLLDILDVCFNNNIKTRSQLKIILKECIHQKYFVFNGKIYNQKDGIPKGLFSLRFSR